MLYLHLPLIQSALGQKVEAKLVGLPHQERSQRWVAMPNDEVASLPGKAGLHLGQSRSQSQRASPFRAKLFGLWSSWTGRVVADAVSGASTTLVIRAIMPSTQHVPLTDEVPRRPALTGRVNPGYKSYTKGMGHASEAGRASPQPRPKGCQQRQSRDAYGRLADHACFERQNLRVPWGPLGFMGLVSPATVVTKWRSRTSSWQLVGSLSNSPQQAKSKAGRFVDVWRNQHGLVSYR
jgi:hypothetical protein